MKNTRFLSFIFVLSTLFISCTKEVKHGVASKDELYLYLDSLEQRYESTCRAIRLHDWEIATGTTSSDQIDSRKLLANIFLDTTTQNTIEEWRNRSSSLADKPLARRLELWHHAFIGGSISLDSVIVARAAALPHHPSRTSAYSDNILSPEKKFLLQMQKEKNRPRRHKFWTNINQITDPALSDYIKLVKAYNEKARAYGFPNYYSLVLYLQGIDEQWLSRTIHSLETLSKPEYERIIGVSKKKFRLKTFTPWDMPLIAVDQPMPLAKYFPSDSILHVIPRFEKELGFPVDSLPISVGVAKDGITSTTYDCAIPNDIRITFGLETGIVRYISDLTAWGEALRFATTHAEYPILKGYGLVNGVSNPGFYQGIAQFHGGLVFDSAWVDTILHPKNIRFLLRKKSSGPVIDLRYALTTFFIEYELYKNPDQNLDSLEDAMRKSLLLTDTSIHEPVIFTLRPEFISSPCNSHTGLIAGMIAAQLDEARMSKFGSDKPTNPQIARWLIGTLYKSGETLEWYERIRNATGKSVEPGAFLRKLGIEQMNLLTKDSKE
jgi:hypothetical protein